MYIYIYKTPVATLLQGEPIVVRHVLGFGHVPAGLDMDGVEHHHDDAEDWLRELIEYNRKAHMPMWIKHIEQKPK